MSTKKRSTKSAKQPKSPKTPKASKPAPQPPESGGLVALDTLEIEPTRGRKSRYDGIAANLIAADDKNAVSVEQMHGRDPLKARSYIYAAMHRSLRKQAPKTSYRVSVTILKGREAVGISIEKKEPKA